MISIFIVTYRFPKNILKVIKYVTHQILMVDIIDKAVKKMKNTEQDTEANLETTKDHAEGKPSSETLNKAKTKIKDALS